MVPSGYGYSLLPGNPPTILISHSGSDSAYGTPTTIALPPDSTTSGQSQYLSMIVTLPAPPGFVPTGLRPLYTMVLPLPTSALSYSQAGGSTASTYIAGSTGGPISVNASSSAGYYVTPEGSTVLLQSSYLSGSPTLGASTETTGPMGSTSTGGSSYTAGSSGESTPSISPGGAIYTGASGNVSVPINPSALATFEGSANKHSAVGTITLVLTGLACICVL
ncbi:hypothetical protein MMC16_005063 [Acarospora aff. strigata]|nr:hypothetical protein [Acarospora aff. strigata]